MANSKGVVDEQSPPVRQLIEKYNNLGTGVFSHQPHSQLQRQALSTSKVAEAGAKKGAAAATPAAVRTPLSLSSTALATKAHAGGGGGGAPSGSTRHNLTSRLVKLGRRLTLPRWQREAEDAAAAAAAAKAALGGDTNKAAGKAAGKCGGGAPDGTGRRRLLRRSVSFFVRTARAKGHAAQGNNSSCTAGDIVSSAALKSNAHDESGSCAANSSSSSSRFDEPHRTQPLAAATTPLSACSSRKSTPV